MIKQKENKGITLVALIITVIILLILAGVTISLVIGENGLISKSKMAIKESNLKSELEKVQLSVTNAGIGKDGTRELTKENLQESLDNGFGSGVAKVSESQDNGSYIIKIGENVYVVNKNGNIEKDETEQVFDANPGEFAGNGTAVDPYLIESIEDLVALATNANSGESYKDKYFKLTKTLDFNSIKSYANYQSKYIYNAEKDGYELNDSGEEIKNLCTTGEGFITIARKTTFEGNIFGNNCSIKNLYINIQPESSNTSGKIGLFGMIENNKIEDLSVTGKIIATNQYIGGIVGYGNNAENSIIIKNCNSDVNIICSADGYIIGGIAGCMYGRIEKCTNTGKIEVNSQKETTINAGGVVGFISKSFTDDDALDIISECSNIGEVKATTKGNNSWADLCVGGIAGYNNGTTIEKSMNYASIYGKCEENNSCVGGITGYNDEYTAKVNNCENKGDVTGSSNQKDAYIGGIVGYAEKGSIAEENVNSGKLDATAEKGTAYKEEFVGKTEE